MNKHKDMIRGFYHHNESYYAGVLPVIGGGVDQVMFGYYKPEGGSSGEMSMQWERLGGKVVPQLRCYDDAWDALSRFGDLIRRLADFDEKNISPSEFCNILKECGFQDLTHRERPL